MNATQVNGSLGNKNQKSTLGSVCVNTCNTVLMQINKAKEALFIEARDTFKVQEQLLRNVLSQAEALAFQTLYPQLVFAELAAEKIQRAAAWSNKQRRLIA